MNPSRGLFITDTILGVMMLCLVLNVLTSHWQVSQAEYALAGSLESSTGQGGVWRAVGCSRAGPAGRHRATCCGQAALSMCVLS